MEQKEQTIQWHPAFFAGIQIELGDEAEYFSFEAEHQLGTKPMAIDVLIGKISVAFFERTMWSSTKVRRIT